MRAKTATNRHTIITAPTNSSLVGQVIFLISALVSLIKDENLSTKFALIRNFLSVTSVLNSGRPGGIRTPNTRIWSPLLYQLELLTHTHFLFYFFMKSISSQLRTKFLERQFSKLTFFRNHKTIISQSRFGTL